MRKLVLWLMISLIANLALAQKNSEVVVKGMQNFDTTKYAGLWYEIARLPVDSENGCFKSVKVDYVIKGNNSYNINTECLSEDNKRFTDDAIAKWDFKDNIVLMDINFAAWWIRWTGYGSKKYMVLDTDYSTYAVLGSPDHENAWIFSRTPKMRVEELQHLVRYLHNNGYDVSSIIYDRTGMN